MVGRPAVAASAASSGRIRCLDLEVRVLQLDVDVVPAEDLGEPVELGVGVGGPALLERLGDPTREAARECDHAGGVTLEELPVDARLVVVALEVAQARELDQVRVALVVGREQGQVRIALLLQLAVVGDVDLAADDRLDPRALGVLEELNRPGHRAVVGERDGRHFELRGPLHEVGNAAGSVQDRVLRVDVEVDEGGVWHRGVDTVTIAPEGPVDALRTLRKRAALWTNGLCRSLQSVEGTGVRP